MLFLSIEYLANRVDTIAIVDEKTNKNNVNKNDVKRPLKEKIVGVAINGSIAPDDARLMLEEADKCADGKWSTILR